MTDAGVSTASALIAIAAGSAVTLVGWFWGFRWPKAVYEATTGRALEVGSRQYRRFRRGRWLMVGFGVFVVGYTVCVWVGIVHPGPR